MQCSHFGVDCEEKKITFVRIRALTSTHAVTMVSREYYGVVRDVRKASGCNSVIDKIVEANFQSMVNIKSSGKYVQVALAWVEKIESSKKVGREIASEKFVRQNRSKEQTV